MNHDLGDPGATTAQRRGDSAGFKPLDRDRLFVFVASGAIWIAGVSLGLGTTPVLALIAAAYVLPSSLALALVRERIGMVSAVLWGCAVALMTVVTIPVAGSMSIVAGLLFGTLSFGVWMGTGFLLLHFFTRHRRTARL